MAKRRQERNADAGFLASTHFFSGFYPANIQAIANFSQQRLLFTEFNFSNNTGLESLDLVSTG
ncbi:hypothetical protein [Flectobacillus roseus]|uniref:Uncharacterized protein n=1 Tax=Flectobacillus roseus TaxID=502259 RepID=A0ABT6YFA5_9BACT|nr:hypothetical protein [Flectobacillus roseus]MDI9862268.1 hypothetical protein [Flectobacillus roseus]